MDIKHFWFNILLLSLTIWASTAQTDTDASNATTNVPAVTAQADVTSGTNEDTAVNTSTVPAGLEEVVLCDNAAGFDAASFIGGIVLMGGILAISFFASMFYQSRNETSYQTLS